MRHDQGTDRPKEPVPRSSHGEGVEVPASKTEVSEPERQGGPLRVLLVTPSSDVKQEVLVMIRQLDHVKPLGATRQIREAHEWIEALQPDAVLLHVGPSDGEALALLPMIRHMPGPPVVVVLSEESSETLKQRCLADGAQVFLHMARPEFDGLPVVLAAL